MPRHPAPSTAVPGGRSRRAALPRRLLLTGGALLAATAVTGCGAVRLGGPAPYTPPPPGIDDLYRIDLLALLDRAIAGTRTLIDDAAGAPAADPVVSDALASLRTSLPVQRGALLTGAERERETQEGTDPAPAATPTATPTDVPADLAGLLDVLTALRDLAAAAARQVSGSLARPVTAIGAHTAWIARRLDAAAMAGRVPAPPAAEQIEPTRDVPADDPPSIGADSDYRAAVETAQEDEWYAGYLHEVLAARQDEDTEDGARARRTHLDQVEVHRTRAAALAAIAAADGAPVVTRQAVYGLPGGGLDERSAGALPITLSRGLLVDHVDLAGAAPFERRPLAIAAALTEGEFLAPRLSSLDPLPGLVEPVVAADQDG